MSRSGGCYVSVVISFPQRTRSSLELLDQAQGAETLGASSSEPARISAMKRRSGAQRSFPEASIRTRAVRWTLPRCWNSTTFIVRRWREREQSRHDEPT
jgi:hypothetical protein